jgi:hypothetical protein
MTKMLLVLATMTAMIVSAGAQPLPLPKQPGQQCPAGYASGASYCTPMPGTTRWAVPSELDPERRLLPGAGAAATLSFPIDLPTATAQEGSSKLLRN